MKRVPVIYNQHEDEVTHDCLNNNIDFLSSQLSHHDDAMCDGILMLQSDIKELRKELAEYNKPESTTDFALDCILFIVFATLAGILANILLYGW